MTDEIRDRRPGHYWADNVIYDKYAERIGLYAFAVYHALAFYAGVDGKCWPSAGAISKKLGISERKVRSSLHVLAEHGLISIQKRTTPTGKRTSNLYTLHAVQGHPARGADEQESNEQKELSHKVTDTFAY